MATPTAVNRTTTVTVDCPRCGNPLSVGIEFDRHYTRGRYIADTLVSAIPDDFRHNRCEVGEVDVREEAQASLAAISARVRRADVLRRTERARWI